MDTIQRKLGFVDSQLAWGRYFHKQIIGACPLLFAVLGLIIGIVLQNWLDMTVWVWTGLLCIAAAAVCGLLIWNPEKTSPLRPIAYVSLICFVCLGAIRLVGFERSAQNDIRHFFGSERQLATIQGQIATEPYINRAQRWQFAKFKNSDPSSSFYFEVNRLKTLDGWAKVSGMVRVQVAGVVLDLKSGDNVQMYCWLDKFKEPTNPGQFNTKKYLARKNVFVAASVKTRESIELLKVKDPKNSVAKIRRKLRTAATQALLGNLSEDDRNRGLLEALLLGYRSNIDGDTYAAFAKTGLLHFISLSGMHLGILVTIIWWFAKTAGLDKPAKAIVCTAAVIIFLLVVPTRPATLRAAVICFVFFGSVIFRRHSSHLNSLSLAAIILLLIRPTGVFEAGWQLSFCSVLGIILFTEHINFGLYKKITEFSSSSDKIRTKRKLGILKFPGMFLLNLFSTGLAAWLGSAGVLLYHFHSINPLTSVWTVIAFPLVGLILIIGFLKIIVAALLPTLAAALGLMVGMFADSLIWLVGQIADWNISEILIGSVNLPVIICYYAIVTFIFIPYLRGTVLKKTISVAAVFALIVFLSVTKFQRTYTDKLVLTALDVGHGQAVLAQIPPKTNILFDAGSLYKSDIGGRIVTPFLRYKGISKVDAIVISHNDIDHINAIPEIARDVKVGGVYANDAFFSKADPWATAKLLTTSLRQRNIQIQRIGENLKVKSDAEIKLLWPLDQSESASKLSHNDTSQVTMIEYAGRKILLCSDIENFAQKELMRLYPSLKVDVVVVPHHGSTKTGHPDFLASLGVETLIYSCGQRQYQSQEKNLAGNLYTAQGGAISVSIRKDGKVVGEYINK